MAAWALDDRGMLDCEQIGVNGFLIGFLHGVEDISALVGPATR